ncbi:MAG: shikimate dehydrogenase, partial [Stygiolobus sp.]|nr:shikimate dehydrogenase [Stygiolobus sp.]
LVRQAMEAEKIWFGKSLDDIEVVNYLYARKLVW